MGKIETRSKTVDNLGNVAGADVVAGYKVYKRDEDSNPRYYGFIDTDGNWYIQRDTLTAAVTVTEYVRGTSDFSTNWDNRATQTYAPFNSVF